MTYLSPTGSYIRKNGFGIQPALPAAQLRGSVLEEQVWSLLETPQTVESLQRAARRSLVGRETLAERGDIERMLERLLDADLIELSPDT